MQSLNRSIQFTDKTHFTHLILFFQNTVGDFDYQLTEIMAFCDAEVYKQTFNQL